MYQDSRSPALEAMLKTLRALREKLTRTMSNEILPRLKDHRISEETKEALKARMEDLKKSLRELDCLEERLQRL